MSVALQMPIETKAAEQVGRRVFRKQVLKDGEITYQGKRLRFDRPYLGSLVESFNAGAFDQVPFVLANEKNEHNEDPDKFRGEVKALELTDDGLDVLVEMTADGAELVQKNPRLGVSARIVEDLTQADGRRFDRAIRHVCATLDPKVTGLREWEMVSLSVRSGTDTGSREQVIDLSASTYMSETATPTLTDEHLEALKGLEGDARVAKARELLGETEAKEEPKGDSKLKDGLRKLLGLKTDDEVDSAIAGLTAGTTEGEKKDEPVTASLTADQRQAIDLANSEAADAKAEAQKARRDVAAANWKLERADLTRDGVPPKMLDLCSPIFEDGVTSVIDLSNGEKVDAADTIRKLLHEAKGTVDLSEARGSSEDKDEREKAQELAKKMGEEA